MRRYSTKIKRENFASFLDRYAEIKGLAAEETPVSADIEPDVPDIPGFFPRKALSEAFEHFRRSYPDLAISLHPHVAPYIEDTARADASDSDVKVEQEKWKRGRLITTYDDWQQIDAEFSQFPALLPFIAKITKVEPLVEPANNAKMDAQEEKPLMKQECHVVRFVSPRTSECIQCCASSSKIVACGTSDGQISLYGLDDVDNSSTTELTVAGLPSALYSQRRFALYAGGISDVQHTGVAENFVSCDARGLIQVWDASLAGVKRIRHTIHCRSSPASRLSVCTETALGYVLSAHFDGCARLFSFDRPDPLRLFVSAHPLEAATIRNNLVATVASTESAIRVFDIRSGGVVRVVSGSSTHCNSLVFLDDERLLALWDDGAVQLAALVSSETVASTQMSLKPNERFTSTRRLDGTNVALGTDGGRVLSLQCGTDSNFNETVLHNSEQDAVVLDIKKNSILDNLLSVIVA